MGYEKGSALLTGENGNKMLKRLATMGNVVGMMVVGSLIVSTVKINIPIEYTVGESTIKIQEMLDGIMPNFFPLLITLLVYYLLKKMKCKKCCSNYRFDYGNWNLFINNRNSSVIICIENS